MRSRLFEIEITQRIESPRLAASASVVRFRLRSHSSMLSIALQWDSAAGTRARLGRTDWQALHH
jgi:hypothetical protein